MKRYFILILFSLTLLLSCKSSYTATELVLSKIESSEKVLKEKPENALVSDYIENLSGIECSEKVELYHQYFGIVNKTIIDKWKVWYEENKDNFYFDADNECLELLPLSKRQKKEVVFLKDKSGNVSSSLSYDQISTCEKLKK